MQLLSHTANMLLPSIINRAKDFEITSSLHTAARVQFLQNPGHFLHSLSVKKNPSMHELQPVLSSEHFAQPLDSHFLHSPFCPLLNPGAQSLH
jgi:hypothetical protein